MQDVLKIVGVLFLAVSIYMIVAGFKMPKIKSETDDSGITTTTDQSRQRTIIIVFGFIFLLLSTAMLYYGFQK
jgi:hypothetical protein